METTPYGSHGRLKVLGNQLVDQRMRPYQLRGVSTHGLSWFPQYVNLDAFKTLRDDWNCNCIRLALYPGGYMGYANGGDTMALKTLVVQGVLSAAKLGMYVIIDWHVLDEHDPLVYVREAATFFEEMTTILAAYPNVIYEICNEPNGDMGNWDRIRIYANHIIPVIRQHAKDNLIIVGTPCWSQEIDKPLHAGIRDNNLMYALHFYAATHGEWLRERLNASLRAGLPVFISEFGLTEASGDGRLDLSEAEQWRNLIDRNNLSCVCWDLSNKQEACSVIRPSCKKLFGWSEYDLSDQGRWVRDWFRSRPRY